MVATKMIKSANFQYFSIISYVVDICWNGHAEAILTGIHNM